MRHLNDIVESVKLNEKCDYEELRYALLVYVFMFNMEHRQLREELIREPRSVEFIRRMKANNSNDMYYKALNRDPKSYLGWDNDPENPEYQKRLKIAYKIADKVSNEEGGGDQ